jgi:DNA modification methylase
MPLSLAKHLIGQITSSEAIVLDPMAGSGTTLIAARQLGRTSWGFDRDPLAVLVAGSAIQDFDSSRLHDLKERILDRAKQTLQKKRGSLKEQLDQLPEEDRDFIDFWFPEKSQVQLLALRQSIKKENEGPEHNLAWAIFSSLIIAKKSGASYALDISRSRPTKRMEKTIVEPFAAWVQRFDAAVKRLPFVDNKQSTMPSTIQKGDARLLPIEEGSVDFVLTSPPYLNAIDYMRGHKFSLLWMGYPLGKLRWLRSTMIGTERGLWHSDGLPSDIEECLNKKIEEDHKKALVRRYLSDMRKVFGEIERVLKPGGVGLFVVGPTIINAKKTDTEQILSQLGDHAGLTLVGSTVRHINATHRSLPPPQLVDRQVFLAKRMSREVIVAFRK